MLGVAPLSDATIVSSILYYNAILLKEIIFMVVVVFAAAKCNDDFNALLTQLGTTR